MLRRSFLIGVFGLAAGPAFAAAPLAIAVDISEQVMTVRIDGGVAYVWPVSTGRKGHRTPTGNYHPVRMYEEYYSKKYDDAPMPHAIFYSGGFAIHGTMSIRSLGRPASHGSVRLHPDNAALLYGLVAEFGSANTSIRITN